MRTRAGKILRGLGRILLGLVLALGLVWVLRVPLFGGLVKREVASRLAGALGGRYAVDDVGGNWITGMRLEGVRTLEAPADGPLVGLAVARVEVDYDLLGLLGDAPLAALDAVRVVGGRVELDLARPAPEGSSEPVDLGVLDDFRGRVDVALDVVVETGEGPATVRGLRAGFGPGRTLELAVEEVALPEHFDVRGPFAGRVARVDDDTWRWTSDATLAGVRIPEATIHRAGRLDATVEVAGGRVVGVLDAERLFATVEAVDAQRLPPWILEQIPESVAPPTSGRLGGSLTLRRQAGPLSTAFDVTVEELVWREERIASARVRGSSTGVRLTLAEVDATGDGVRLRGRDVRLDLQAPTLLRGASALTIDVDSLRAFVPGLEHDVSVSLRASGAEPERLTVESLLVRHDRDRLEARGTVRFPPEPAAWRRTVVDLAFDGALEDPETLGLPWSGAVRLAGTASGALEDLTLDLGLAGDAVAVEGRPVEGARLVGVLRWPEIEVATLEVRAPGLTVDASGLASLEPFRFADASWRLAIDDLAQVAPLLPADAPALAGAVRTDGRLSWDGEAVSGEARLAATRLAVDGEALGAVALTLDGRAGGPLRIPSFEADGPWGRVRGAASVDLAGERATVEALTYGDEADVSPRAVLRAPLRVSWGGGEVRLAGLDADVDGTQVRLEAFVRPDEKTAQLERLEVERPDLRVRLAEPARVTWLDDVVTVPRLQVEVDESLRLRASLAVDLGAERVTMDALEVEAPDLAARILAPLRIARRGEELLVEDVDAVVRGIRFRAAGRVRPDAATAVLEALRVQDGDVEAWLEAPLRLAWSDAAVTAEGLDVAAFGGRLSGDVSWDGDLHADVAVEGLGLTRWVEALEGAVSARIRVDGERLAVEAEIPELGFQTWRGAVRVEAVQDETGPLRLARIRLTGPRGRTVEGEATLPWRLTPAGIVAVEGARADLALRGALGGLGLFTDVADGPVTLDVRGDDEGLDVRVRIADVGLCDPTMPCDDVGFELRITPAEVRGRIALGSDEFLKMRGHLHLDRGFDWLRPGTLGELVAEATIDAAVDTLVASWTPLARMAPSLRRLEGGTRLALTARGPLRAPTVEGVLTLSQVAIALDSDVAPFEQVDARLVWQDDLIRVERLEGLMGYAPFAIQGTVRLLPEGLPTVDLTVRGENTQLIRTEWFRLRIDVDARVTGPVDRMHVAGEGRIVDAIYREPVSLTGASGSGDTTELILFEIEDAPFDEMTFDLGVRANDTIHIRNNLLRVDVSYEGRLRGTGARPALEGRAFFRNAEILLPLTTLRNGTGEIEFLAGSPGRPRIQMTAQTRTKGYEMGLQLAGRLPDVNLQIFTEPPLDEEDATLMLATGSTGAELAQGGILGKTLASVASIFGGSLFTSRSDGAEPGKKAFFERFEVSADVDGADLRELDAEFELDRRFYLHVQRDRYEATNLGLIWRLRFR